MLLGHAEMVPLYVFPDKFLPEDISLTNVCLIGKPSFEEGAKRAWSPSAPI